MLNDILHLQEHYALKSCTTFKIGGPAKYMCEVSSHADLCQALAFTHEQHLNLVILGGGNNVLASDRGFDGVVLRMNTKGIHILAEDEQGITVKVAAGEVWDDVVAWAVSNGWWGIENLTHIPGKAGAFAIQNVGAYGQEAREVIDTVEVCEIATGERRMLPHSACHFSYRTSVFNSAQKGQYIILATVLRLKKHGAPNLRYPDVKAYFTDKTPSTLPQLRAAIIHIRERKLPDPEQIGNAGSFFKNFMLCPDEFERLKNRVKLTLGNEDLTKVEALGRNDSPASDIKIPTALLLDVCGLKGLRVGGAALYEKHPLIVVNADGQATAHDVMSLMKLVRQKVFHLTGIEIVPEPDLIGFTPEELQGYFRLT
jgi:UDP-N-acetylmuramate dehydrogenase